jgi:CheY-like chemotaxis protein/predicted regulator of Ras-like GTPase activity (Roadblock/LC7/MglB family)
MVRGDIQTVLLVDDEEFFLRSMVDGFAAHRQRLRVLTAPNGRVALEELARTPVDLVVTDLKMPELDGFQLVAELSRRYPGVPVVVMTAFSTAPLEAQLRDSGVSMVLDKPIDFPALSKKVFEVLAASASGHLRGISLATLLQMVEADRKTCTVNVSSGGAHGWLVFRGGELLDAATGELHGDAAALEILAWDEAAIDLAGASANRQKVVTQHLSELLMEAFRLRDERARANPGAPAEADESIFTLLDDTPELPHDLPGVPPAVPAVPVVPPTKESADMSAQDKLKELSAIDGFSGAAVYTPTGEVLAMLAGDVGNLKDVGVLANAVLLNAQKSSLEMGTGRGQQVHVEAEKAHILVRCLNEGNDPIRSQPGKAHIHLAVVLKSDASIGLAKMRINSVVEKLAEDFRM